MGESYETLIVEREGAVVTVTLNRPERKNAMNGTMFAELGQVFLDTATRVGEVRVLVLKGAGGAFCSGADLSGGGSGDVASQGAPSHPLINMDSVNRVALTLHDLPQPTIAAIDGDAVGAGCNLALGCDITLATPRSRLAQIFVRRGLAPDFGGSYLVPRLVGMHKAKLLCLTGDLISGADAVAMGLVSELVEADQLDSRVREIVEKLVAAAPIAQTLAKRLLNAGSVSTMAEALEAEGIAQSVNLLSDDAREARDAFVNKRPPVFRGR